MRLGASPGAFGTRRCSCAREVSAAAAQEQGVQAGRGDSAFFTAGMSVRYTCNAGFYLVGNAAVFCRASGNWSQPRPRCEGEPGLCPLWGQTPRVALSTRDTPTKSTETFSERLNSILMKYTGF
uniref:Sushi domain-containing protein n=1 Tax=Ficedula albicollis TaxID=59894 RepID=A0A803VLE3_FICAL